MERGNTRKEDNMHKRSNGFLLEDIAIIFLSIVLAVILVKTDALTKILTSSEELEIIGSFIAGFFFTSVLTTAPAIVTLGEIAQVNSVVSTAFFGAIGAMLGDLVIFRFIKDRLSDHLAEIVRHEGGGKRLKALFRIKLFRWLTFLAGGLILASPLPDELGISLLGLAHMKTSWFMPLSFAFNFIGILAIGLIARGALSIF